MNRRHFIKSSALASSFLMVPKVLKPLSNIGLQNQQKNLVVIQLSGGNDGLNTFAPYRDDLYYKARPSIGLAGNNLIKLSDTMGMNAAMQSLQKWYDAGQFSIINSVGYPDMDHSHFRSMEIWQTASKANEYLSNGWLGRWMDEQKYNYAAVEIDESLSLAVKGKDKSAMAFTDIQKINQKIKQSHIQQANNHDQAHESALANYLYKTLNDTEGSMQYIHEKSKLSKNVFTYPDTYFGKQLKTIADLIISGLETKVYYVSLSGFDTHTNELLRHGKMMKTYAEAVDAFLRNLKLHDKLNDTLVMTFSEFGRRVEENAAKGTDHGTAGNVWFMGPQFKKAGFLNTAPNLQDLNDGDLIYQEDFRNIYATILDNWLEANSKKILGESFKQLNFI
jgi:uncharacterized protein (DUF1501 family)